jgi:hypothetical protein
MSTTFTPLFQPHFQWEVGKSLRNMIASCPRAYFCQCIQCTCIACRLLIGLLNAVLFLAYSIAHSNAAYTRMEKNTLKINSDIVLGAMYFILNLNMKKKVSVYLCNT